MDEQRENMQNGMIENETTGEQKPDGGKERRRRGMGAGILLGICGTLVVGALGIYLTCRFTGSQILITNAAADTDGTTLLDAGFLFLFSSSCQITVFIVAGST